jgi:tetratricopeptide (TPR) repeat protein
MRFGRGEYASARAMAERMQGIGGRHRDPVLEVAAHNLAGLVLASQGELEAAREALQRGIALAESIEGGLPPARFLVDAIVAMRSNLSRYLQQLGLPDEAREQVEAALKRARELGQPLALSHALRCAGMLEARQGHPQRVAEIAAELERLVVNHSLIQAEGASHCLGGWAQARLGEAQAGYSRILSAYEMLKRVGMVAGYTEVLCYAADAALQAGLHEAALAHVDEAQALAERLGEGINLRELAALRARINS